MGVEWCAESPIGAQSVGRATLLMVIVICSGAGGHTGGDDPVTQIVPVKVIEAVPYGMGAGWVTLNWGCAGFTFNPVLVSSLAALKLLLSPAKWYVIM